MQSDKTVFLVCGVPGSGKTWVCRQLTEKFTYVPHDEHIADPIRAVRHASLFAQRPIITECPFGERQTRDQLESLGFVVRPIFIVELPETVERRYFEREGKPLYKGAVTRARTIVNRADEWNAPWGTSAEVLKYLQEI